MPSIFTLTPPQMGRQCTVNSPNVSTPGADRSGVFARPESKAPVAQTSQLFSSTRTSEPNTAHPFIKMPKSSLSQQNERTERRVDSMIGNASEPSKLQSARRRKAERVWEAWHSFNEVLLNVDQEPDDEEDEDLYDIMEKLFRMNHHYAFEKGVLPLIELAKATN
ncbi:hypothetical protein AB5N19_13179 [Seiridium cardinale]